jgi:hypothetical protein
VVAAEAVVYDTDERAAVSPQVVLALPLAAVPHRELGDGLPRGGGDPGQDGGGDSAATQVGHRPGVGGREDGGRPQ